MNIKFPKEEIQVIEKVRNAILNDNYQELLDLKESVINHAAFINQFSKQTLDTYIKTIFDLRLFEEVITIVEEIRLKDIEDCKWYYYVFASLIANKDFLYLKRILNKSKLLSDKSISYLIDKEEANYNAIFNLHYELLETIGPCLILINFINELISESLNNELDEEYLIMRFFDLLNLLFEYGVDEDIVYLFEETIKTIYEIPID